MKPTTETINPPVPLLHLLEIPRSMIELGILLLSEPLHQPSSDGDGHPVLVIPGLAADDSSTIFLRKFLKKSGFDPHPWGLGRNLGSEAARDIIGELLEKVTEIHERTGNKVSLIGWSLGGVYSREIAKLMPEKIRQVITLGSPISGDAKANNAWRLYEALSGHSVQEEDPVETEKRREAPTVPTTSIYSKTDGVVAWQCSLEKEGDLTENIEVTGSHCGLAHNLMVFYAVADRLSQKEGEWSPFDLQKFDGMISGKGLLLDSKLTLFPHSLFTALNTCQK